MSRLVLIGCAAALVMLALIVFGGEEGEPPREDLLGTDLAPGPRAAGGLLRSAARPEDPQRASSADEAARSTLPTGPFEFFVMSGETEDPLDEVRIETEEGDPIGTTGSDGRLRIEDGGAAELILRATRAGYLPHEGYASARQLTRIVLQPGIPISGTVVLENSESPVPHARMQVWDVDLAQRIATLSTDEEGHFEILAVRPNRPFRMVTVAEGLVPRIQTENFDAPITDLVVRIGGGGTLVGTVLSEWDAPVGKKMVQLLQAGERRSGSGHKAPRPGLLPGFADARIAKTVTDETGQFRFTGIPTHAVLQPVVVMGPRFEARGKAAVFKQPDLILERDVLIPRPAALRVHIEDDTGRTLRHARVQVIAGREIWYPGAKDRQPDGSLLLQELTPGKVRVRASIDAAPRAPDAPDPVELIAGQEESVRVEFPRGLALHGVVRDKRGVPVWRAKIGWSSAQVPESAGTVTDAAGQFRLTRLPDAPGTVTVQTHAIPYPVRGFEAAKVEDVRPGPKPIEIELKDGTQVRGRFRDLARDAPLHVALSPGGPAGAGSLWLDEKKGFSWRGPAAGHSGMLIFRTPGSPPLVWTSGAPFASEEVRDLGDLVFAGSRPFLGRVLSAHEVPLRAVKVTLTAPWGDGRAQRTNRDGEFQFARLPDRKTTIRLDLPGLPPNRATMLPASQDVRQTFRMYAVGYLRLKVLDGRNRPAQGAEVQYWTEKEAKRGRLGRSKSLKVSAKGIAKLKLAPDAYLVLVSTRRGREITDFTVTIKAGQTVEKTVKLESRWAYARRKRREGR